MKGSSTSFVRKACHDHQMSLMLTLRERVEMKGRTLTVTQTAFDCLPRTRDFLIDVAREGVTVTYGEVKGELDLPYAPNGAHRT